MDSINCGASLNGYGYNSARLAEFVHLNLALSGSESTMVSSETSSEWDIVLKQCANNIGLGELMPISSMWKDLST